MGVAAAARWAHDFAERHIDSALYETLPDWMVARQFMSHGIESCMGRWWYVQPRTLATMARRGMLANGFEVRVIDRQVSTPPDLEAAAVEAAIVLGSAHAAERGGGLAQSAVLGNLARRGLRPPAGIAHLRGIHAKERKMANGGDLLAAARIEAREAHERSVVQVLRRALNLVPHQPVTGRYRLPKPGPALDAAVAGLPADAVSAVFPKSRA